MKRLWCLFLLAAALTIVAIGCTGPIFYILATEDPIEEDRGLPEDLSVFRIVRATEPDPDQYFLAAGTLFTRKVEGQMWFAVDPPPVEAGLPLCNAIELWDEDGVGGTPPLLYAGWFDAQTGEGLGLWSLNPAAGEWVPDTGEETAWTAPPWTARTNGGVTGQGVQIGLLKDPGSGTLVVGVGTSTAPKSYALYGYPADGSFDDGTPDTPLVASSSFSFTDVGWDSVNLEYWALTAGLAEGDRRIYTGAAGPLASLGTLPSTEDDKTEGFGGVLFVDATPDRYYVSTYGGTICLSTDGGATWSYSDLEPDEEENDSDPITEDGDTVGFTRFLDLTAQTGDVYVGTQGFGYYVLPDGELIDTDDPENPENALERNPPSNISGLYFGAINSFLLDTAATPLTLFVCTSGAGLWRGELSGGDWVWRQERDED